MLNVLRILPFYPVWMILFMVFKNRGIYLSKVPIFTFFLVRFILLEPFRLTELLLFERRIHRFQLKEDPIFIIGHWRSGTTHLQHLMSIDDKYATTSVFHFLFPDTFILCENWLKKPLNKLCKLLGIPYSFQRVPMDLDLPGELESAMCALGSPYSYTWGHMFPKNYPYWKDRLITIKDKKDVKGWLRDYEYLIKKFSYASGGKRMIVKSPGDTARIHELVQRFPNAQFIYIERDPIEVYNSSIYFWKVITREISFQKLKDDQIKRYVLDTYLQVMSSYKEKIVILKEEQLIEIKFEDLTNDPLSTISYIYSKFNLGEVPMDEMNKLFVKRDPQQKTVYSNTNEELCKIKETWSTLTTL